MFVPVMMLVYVMTLVPLMMLVAIGMLVYVYVMLVAIHGPAIDWNVCQPFVVR